jgi:hypothetical protein
MVPANMPLAASAVSRASLFPYRLIAIAAAP